MFLCTVMLCVGGTNSEKINKHAARLFGTIEYSQVLSPKPSIPPPVSDKVACKGGLRWSGLYRHVLLAPGDF